MGQHEDVLAAIAAASTNLDLLNTALDGIAGDVSSLKALIAAGGSIADISTAVDALGAKTQAATTKAQDIDAGTPPTP